MEGLRELRLDETSVEDLCPSISSLENVESLSLKQCKKLHSLPSSIHMRSLRTLNLSGCSNLDNFSEIPEVMNLLELNLDETAISELPSSIKKFYGTRYPEPEGLQKIKDFSRQHSYEISSSPECFWLLKSEEFSRVSRRYGEPNRA
ncbi:hypothetical protein ACFX1X_028462 [Malus domestica]